MQKIVLFILCSLAVVVADDELILEADKPFLRVALSEAASLHCCYRGRQTQVTWFQSFQTANRTVNAQVVENSSPERKAGAWCGTLSIKSVQLNSTGLYQCLLNGGIYSHGTYLQVFKPMEKTIDLSESTKNKILVAEGVLLLLCVLIPSGALMFKSKNQSELEKKKAKKEEENIYQGLNLDDCCEVYDQIECTPARGQYQDVGSFFDKEEDIQLEKP